MAKRRTTFMGVSMCALLVALVAVWHVQNTTDPASLEAEIDALVGSDGTFQTQSLSATCALTPEGKAIVREYEKKFRVMYRNKAESAASFRNALDPIITRTEYGTQKRCILEELRNYLDYMVTNQNLFRGRMRN